MVNILMTDDNVRLLIAHEEFMWLVYENASADKKHGDGTGDWKRVAKEAGLVLGRPLAPDVLKGAAGMLMNALQVQERQRKRRFEND